MMVKVLPLLNCSEAINSMDCDRLDIEGIAEDDCKWLSGAALEPVISGFGSTIFRQRWIMWDQAKEFLPDLGRVNFDFRGWVRRVLRGRLLQRCVGMENL